MKNYLNTKKAFSFREKKKPFLWTPQYLSDYFVLADRKSVV